MTDQKTIAIFGAGTGLGASLARKFGRQGFRVAPVARNAAALADMVAALAADGIEAKAFPADLTDLKGLPGLVRSIEDRFGSIDVAVYAPVSPEASFVPAVQLDAHKMEIISRLYTLAPIEIGHLVLQNMLTRGSGALVVTDGLTAIHTMPGLSGVGPAFSAVRNWLFTLHEEIKDKGIYVGMLHIGALIDRSAGLTIAIGNGRTLPVDFPLINPDDLADEIWKLVTERDRVEAILPVTP